MRVEPTTAGQEPVQRVALDRLPPDIAQAVQALVDAARDYVRGDRYGSIILPAGRDKFRRLMEALRPFVGEDSWQ